jgi:hypothetical protein
MFSALLKTFSLNFILILLLNFHHAIITLEDSAKFSLQTLIVAFAEEGWRVVFQDHSEI